MNLVPLTRWQRFVQWWTRYAPIPWRRCMFCRRWFFNRSFWRLSSMRWGIPEHCSRACANALSEAAEVERVLPPSVRGGDG